jgi:hypothetical protein
VALTTEIDVAAAAAADARCVTTVLKLAAVDTLNAPSPPDETGKHELSMHPNPVVHVNPAMPPLTPQPAVAPQYVLLLVGSMHEPPHATSVPGQPQPLVVHTAPGMQLMPALPPAVPQPAVAPQYCVLLVGSTQLPPQLIWPLAQHTPSLHC